MASPKWLKGAFVKTKEVRDEGKLVSIPATKVERRVYAALILAGRPVTNGELAALMNCSKSQASKDVRRIARPSPKAPHRPSGPHQPSPFPPLSLEPRLVLPRGVQCSWLRHTRCPRLSASTFFTGSRNGHHFAGLSSDSHSWTLLYFSQFIPCIRVVAGCSAGISRRQRNVPSRPNACGRRLGDLAGSLRAFSTIARRDT